ncbi:hypothetical protein [Nocardioides astragali]|uniref:Lipoprotein n=1 Tax=Nocardioides astragali TaxID=1776736 RepID=A0ABW2MWZ0_9ACTN|nr:hypothetical protein [Nocardioides astragali]
MVKRTPIGVWLVTGALLLTGLAGCSSDGEDPPEGDKPEKVEKAVEAVELAGSFVGEVSGTKAFVAVVAAPAQEGQDAGAVQVYVSDGNGVSEWFSAPVSDGGFAAQSDDGDAEAEGKLSGGSVIGTVSLPDGSTGSYEANPPSGGAGLYELTVSPGGELSGASAAGLALKGDLSLGRRGTGTIRMVDGKRLKLALTRKRAEGLGHLRAGQVRLIVLPGGELRGVARAKASKGGAGYFIRSA